MKLNRTAVAVTAMLLALLTALSACGGERDESDEDTTQVYSDNVYLAEYKPLGDIKDYVTAVMWEDLVYYQYTDSSNIDYPETDEEWEDWIAPAPEYILGVLDPVTGESQQATFQFESESEYINSFQVSDEGNFVFLTTDETWEEDEFGMLTSSEAKMFLREYGPDGNQVDVLDMSDIIRALGGGEYFYIEQFLIHDGLTYLSCSSSEGSWIYVIDDSGDSLMELEVQWARQLVLAGNGKVCALHYTYDDVSGGYVLAEIDTEARDWGGEWPVAMTNFNYVYPAQEGDDFDFYIDDGLNMYSYVVDTGETESLFNWVESGLALDYGYSVGFLSDSRVAVLCNNWDDEGMVEIELVLLTPTPRSEVPEKETIVLGGLYLYGDVKTKAVEFNKQSQTHQILLTDYSIYNTEDDYSAGMTRMMTEITTGGGPDILVTSGDLNVENLAAKGALLDLYTLLDSDPDIDRGDLFENVLEAMEIDGTLPVITPSFAVTTMVGRPEVVGTEPGWTIGDMMTLIDDNPDVEFPMGQGLTQTDFLWILLYVSSGEFFDWATGECNLDSDEFVRMLETARRFPSEYQWDEDTYRSEYELLAEGEQLVAMTYFSNFNDYQLYSMILGDITTVGLPVQEGEGHMLQAADMFAISATSDYRDEAWSFIRQFLLEEYQEGLDWYFPISTKVYEKKLAEAMDEETFTGGGISFADSDIVYEYEPLTREEADGLTALVRSPLMLSSYDETILDIVTEEAEAFFAGDKSAADTAQVIQSRVQTYMNEHM